MSTGHSFIRIPLLSLCFGSPFPQFPGSAHSSGPLQPHCVRMCDSTYVCVQQAYPQQPLLAVGSFICICNTMQLKYVGERGGKDEDEMGAFGS